MADKLVRLASATTLEGPKPYKVNWLTITSPIRATEYNDILRLWKNLEGLSQSM